MRKNLMAGSVLLCGCLAFLSFRTESGNSDAHREAVIKSLPAGRIGDIVDRPAAGPMTAGERKFVLDYYQKTKQRLLSDIRGLSDAQLNYKADSTRWSIAQCTEHISAAESLIWQWMQMTIHQPATPEKSSEVKLTTEQLVANMTDRSHKFQAPEMLKPDGKFPDFRTALISYAARRDSTITYLTDTQDDLSDHFINHPVFGTMTVYQGFVLLAAHSARHTLQIEEVKADPGFPKQ